MHISIQKQDSETYFVLPMMMLKVEQIKSYKKKRLKKSKNE